MTPLRPLHDYRRVLLRLPNAVGDTIMATPLLRRLAAGLPPGRIAVAGPSSSLDLLAGCPWFASSLTIQRKDRHAGLSGLFRLANDIQRLDAELAMILPNSIGAAIAPWLARVPERLGYFKEGRRVLLTAGRPRERDEAGRFRPQYTGRYFDELADLIPDLEPGVMRPELFEDERGREEAAAWARGAGLRDGEPLLIVVPGAAFGPSKIWLAARYAEVAAGLARRFEARVLISYGPGEERIAGEVKGALEALGIQPLPDARMSLRGLKSVFRGASFVLTNDTGPRHLAVAFGVPHAVIMGPNDPRYTHLDGDGGEVLREDVACSPCQLKVCPLDEQICMTHLTAARVLDRCVALWPLGARRPL